MRSSRGKNKQIRSSVQQISIVLEQICTEKNEDTIEYLYYELHRQLCILSRFIEAKQLLDIYMKRSSKFTLSPTHGFANQIQAGRSSRQQQALRLFLKEQSGMNVYPSYNNMQEIADSYKPRSTGFELYGRNDEGLIHKLKEHIPPVRPPKPALKNLNKEQKQEVRKIHKESCKRYKSLLDPPPYKNKFPGYPESPQPDCLAVVEQYEILLAAAVKDLGGKLLENIDKNNATNPNKILPGLIETTITVYDGCDGKC